MNSTKPFPSFSEFVKSLSKRNASKLFARTENTFGSESELEHIRSYLQHYYKNAASVHSFMDHDGLVWDCMPQDRLPNLRKKKKHLDQSPSYPGNGSADFTDRNLQYIGKKDEFGNDTSCPHGFIPVRRVTLEAIAKFKTIESFKQKKTQSSLFTRNGADIEEKIADDDGHRYACVSQIAPNRGGGSILSLWQPAVFPDSGQLFSLSQVWIIGGTGQQLQTVEVGWQVCPERWGTTKPVLFIYFTSDNYGPSGSYNLEGGAFQQTNNNWRLGGTLSPVSVIDGDQYDMIAEWFMINNAWWLYLNRQAVGYYPSSLFGGGSLSFAADAVVTGGEVSGNQSRPPMGSGIFSQQRFKKSAYVRNALIRDLDGIIHPLQMSPKVTSPNCYSLIPAQDPNWGSAVFYGGPGGNNC